MAKTAVTNVLSETMEETKNKEKQASSTRDTAGMGLADKRVKERVLEIIQNSTIKQSPWPRILTRTRTQKFSRKIQRTSFHNMNRRIPNGTYGGVKGGG